MEIEVGTQACWARAISACGPEVPGSEAGALCSAHRADLVPLAQALLDLDLALCEVGRLREVRKGLQKAWTPVRLTVDGVNIERAVLKLVLDHAARAEHDWQAPVSLAAAVFGKQALPTGCGAALIARVGDSTFDSARTAFSLAKSDRSGNYECAVLELREGWKLLCTWDVPIARLGTLRLGAERYEAGEDTLFHPRRVSFRNKDVDLGVSLDFDWSGRWSESKYPNVAKLRKARGG